ncbi:MAG TPA: hypothetical protein VMH61_06575 [Candidatus Acidoferrales bacterium]|nr:hypothetical protein [Candidatus Acidoferrales bacterium]
MSPRATDRPAASGRLHGYPLGLLLLLGALAGLVVTPLLHLDPHLNPDSLDFEAIARSLLAGHGFVYREAMFPSLSLYAFRAPGYPLFLAAGLALGGVRAAIALNGIVTGLAAALVGAIAFRLGGARAGWIAFAIRMVWPVAWWNAGQLMSETLFEFLTVLATWLALECVQRRSTALAVASGGVAAAALLTRPVGVMAALALGIWLVARRPRAAVAFALAALMAWSPWPIRNAKRLHAFVPMVTSSGLVRWTMHAGLPPSTAWAWMAAHSDQGELAMDRHFRAENSRLAHAPLLERLRDTMSNTLTYLGPIRGRTRELWLHRFAMLAAFSALLLPAARPRLVLPALLWLSQGALMISLEVSQRFRFPTDWCVVIAAAVGLAALADRWGARRTALAAAAALALCVAGTIVVARP